MTTRSAKSTTLNADGSVTYWSVTARAMRRTCNVPDYDLAAMTADEQAKIAAHTASTKHYSSLPTPATPAKLKCGGWGAWTDGGVTKGETLVITAKNGKRWMAEVYDIVWSGNGRALVSTVPLQSHARMALGI